MWHRSRIKWSSELGAPVSLEVYYHSGLYLLPVLAHEVGHLETMAELGGIAYYQAGAFEKYNCEYHASSWALKYLAGHGVKGARLKAFRDILQGCLNSYGEDVQGRKLVLEVEA